MKSCCLLFLLTFCFALVSPANADVSAQDRHIFYSPYNWLVTANYAQTPNPGAYLKVGFTGTKMAVKLDLSLLTGANVAANQYPVIRYSVDGKPAKTLQLYPTSASISCASGLSSGNHTLLMQYVSGFVFLDFWTPINALRITGFTLDEGASLIDPVKAPHYALFLGDSITNGDDDIATFSGGITNAVDTQDGTLGYPAVVASALHSEFGVVAYGGASWDNTAADQHTPGLLKLFSMLDSLHSRLVNGKLSPMPDDIFINMGENSPPSGADVTQLLAALRAASSEKTNIFVIVPFSGRSRLQLAAGIADYLRLAKDKQVFFLDLGDNPFLMDAGPTMFSVDGQHPLATLHAQLGAQIVQARADALASARK